MSKFTVTMENTEGRAKRVTVLASDAADAMAEAEMSNAGWTAVQVC